MKRIVLCLLAMVLLPVLAFGQTTETGKPTAELWDADLALGVNPNDSLHLDSNTVWILKDGVFVDSGCILSIDPGTVIKGEPGTGTESKYLCVARGGRIYANGTADKPIIFTGDVDNVDDPYDIDFGTNGLWGGLIILGGSVCNTPDGTNQIEGIPSEEPRGNYGGGAGTSDSLDNSGVIRYVSIRHGGTEIGAANEINGLTMGAVGASTTIEYVEVYNNYDDGFEWFGGTVNTRYLVSAFNGDDCFDYDEGFRGNHQFWFAIQDSAIGNHLGEHDGAIGDEQGEPFAEPYVYNMTYIGSGSESENADGAGIIFRDNAGGHYANGIIGYTPTWGIKIEDLTGSGVHDSRERLENGDLTVTNMVFYDFGNGSDPLDVFPVNTYGTDSTSDFAMQYLTDAANGNTWTVDPMLNRIDRHEAYHLLDPRLDPASPANTPGESEPSDPFFTDVDYKGAFPPDGSKNSLDGIWISGWTNMWQRAHAAFICGDANGDKLINVSDAVRVINYIFIGGAAPFPRLVGDANCDYVVNVSDAVRIINYVFIGGTAPCAECQ